MAQTKKPNNNHSLDMQIPILRKKNLTSNISILYLKLIFLITLTISSQIVLAENVTWQDQAERLLKVSATQLDSAPFGEPLKTSAGIGIQSNLSFLPKINSKIGDKKESVPYVPVHTVPHLKLEYEMLTTSQWNLGGYGYAGYLYLNTKPLTKQDMTIKQWLVGGALVSSLRIGAVKFFQTFSLQVSQTQLSGEVTQKGYKDDFHVTTQLKSFSLGVSPTNLPFWLNVTIGQKNSQAEFYIEVDQTTLKASDSLDDSPQPYYYQAALGFEWGRFQFGIAEIYVPKRVIMPRLLIGYMYDL